MRIDIIFLVVLFIWWTFIMTGLRIGKNKICGSAVKEKDILCITMWCVLLILMPLYMLGYFAANAAMSVFLLLWIGFQCFITIRFVIFPNERKTKSYNEYFKDRHYIIRPSNKRLVPDTYHIVLFVLIIICLVLTAINLFTAF